MWIIRVCMVVLAPVAWPLAFILNKVPSLPAAACRKSLAYAMRTCTAPPFVDTDHSRCMPLGKKSSSAIRADYCPTRHTTLAPWLLLFSRQYAESLRACRSWGARSGTSTHGQS